MNKFYSAAAVLFMASQLASPLRAEPDAKAPPPDRPSMEERHEKRESKMLDKMTEKLNLTSDQQKSVKAILDKQGDKMEAVGKDGMEKRKTIHDDTEAQIAKLLTPEQKKKFDEWKETRKEHMKERREDRRP